jgi:hypothetical protein
MGKWLGFKEKDASRKRKGRQWGKRRTAVEKEEVAFGCRRTSERKENGVERKMLKEKNPVGCKKERKKKEQYQEGMLKDTKRKGRKEDRRVKIDM